LDGANRAAERHVVTLTLEDRRPDREITKLYKTFERLYGPVYDWPGCVFDAQDHAGVVAIAHEQISWAKEQNMKFKILPSLRNIDNMLEIQFTFTCVKEAIFFKLRWA
jgi:hypothetical protein